MGDTPIAVAGPFQGVRTVTNAPYEDASKFLYDARNGYIRDAGNNSSWVARPGFTLANSSGLSGNRMQGSCAHVDPATGTISRFFAIGGALYSSNDTFTAFTDVTPVGITIDPFGYNVSFLSVGASLVVTDGTHRPWIASDLNNTPITGTYIDIDGAGGAWSSWGKPTLYQDSVVFITQAVPVGSAIQSRVGIVWCEPNQPAVGYTQTGYTDFWNIIENGSDELWAILGTNNGLYYWRQNSIGLAAGTPSVNFSSTATRDAISSEIGSVAPWAIAIFDQNIFFTDIYGRPWMMQIGASPQPIWQQMYSVTVNAANVTNPGTIALTSAGGIVPELNQYVVAAWSISNVGLRTLYAFDAFTGAYSGTWDVGGGINAEVMVTQRNNIGEEIFCVCGGKAAVGGAGGSGWVWILSRIMDGVWVDTGNTHFNPPQFVTGAVGYAADRNFYPDTATFILTSTGDLSSVVVAGSYGTVFNNTMTVPAPPQTFLQVRATLGLDGNATRFLRFTVAGPSSPTAQWGVQRVEVFGATSGTGPEDY